MSDAVDRFGEQLVAAAQTAQAAHTAPPREPRINRSRRLADGTRIRGLRLSVIMAALVIGLAAAAVAATVILSGAPVRQPAGQPLKPTTGVGTPISSSIRLLGVAVPDPVSGPSWGLRYARTSRGLGCLQVGRLVNGQLGVLGQDHAFGNDHRFHALPAGVGWADCQSLDAHYHAYFADNDIPTTASAMPNLQSCRPVGSRPASGSPICATGDWRILYYGLLGPDAVSVTYRTPAGGLTTTPVTRPEGAYLIVATPHGPVPTQFTPSISPVPPITRITYRSGHVCYTTSQGRCPRLGYTPRALPTPSAAQVTARVRVGVGHGPGYPLVHVAFRARYPVRDINGAYVLSVYAIKLAERSAQCTDGVSALNETNGDIKVGQRVRVAVGPSNCTGRYRVTVFYAANRGTPNFPGATFPGDLRHGGTRVAKGSGEQIVATHVITIKAVPR